MTPDPLATPYLEFAREEWASLRASTPMTLSEVDIERIKGIRKGKLSKLLIGQTCDRLVNAETGELIAKAGRKISEKFFDALDILHL